MFSGYANGLDNFVGAILQIAGKYYLTACGERQTDTRNAKDRIVPPLEFASVQKTDIVSPQ